MKITEEMTYENGVITYDRKVVKLRADKMRAIAEKIKKEL